jgi:hypothetical protein
MILLKKTVHGQDRRNLIGRRSCARWNVPSDRGHIGHRYSTTAAIGLEQHRRSLEPGLGSLCLDLVRRSEFAFHRNG